MRRFPFYGYIGLILVAVFWPLNWWLPGLRTHWGFFPLWLGYCLAVEGMVERRKGNSLLKNNWKAYLSLFAFSAPAWWLFELLNLRTQNWVYQGQEYFSDVEFALLASLSFSTVMPAVFSTAALVNTFPFFTKKREGWELRGSRPVLAGMFIAGLTMLASLLVWPDLFFPFVWGSVFCLVEPVNAWKRFPSVFDGTSRGDWRPVLALLGGVLICGFFWECWNFYSYPRWVYRLPWGDYLHVFEMPLPGYIGYLPFALELFAVYHFLSRIIGVRNRFNLVEMLGEG